MKIEGAIFDLDGTLLDSMSIWETLGEDYLSSKGKKAEVNLKEKLETMSLIEAAEYFVSEYGLTLTTEEILEGFNEMISDYYSERAIVKPGVKEFLEKLKSRNVKMCIATSNDRKLVEKSLEKNDMLGYFEHILTCNEVGFGKDNVEIFKRGLNLLGTSIDKTYVFEDALFAIKTVKQVGLPVVGVFDESWESQQEEIKKIADVYINSFFDMEDYFD